MKLSATTQTCTAYHEAGHVVLAYVSGLRIVGVSVQRDDDSFGRTFYGFVASLGAREVIDGRARRRIEACVLCYLAGMEAEARFAGRRSRKGAASDLAEAAECAWHVVLSDEELDAYLRWLAVRVRYLVAAYWVLIDGLARRLLRRETMSGREVHEALRTMSVARRTRRRSPARVRRGR